MGDSALKAMALSVEEIEENVKRRLRGQIEDALVGHYSPVKPFARKSTPERVVPPFPQRAYDRMRSGEAPIVEDFWKATNGIDL